MTKELSPRILVNIVPNPLCRSYHANTRLINDGYIERFHFPLRESSEKYLEKVGPVGAEVARKLNDVLGITEASFSLYHIQILIDDVFSWDDGIHDAIVEAMKGVFGDRRDEVEVKMDDKRHLYRRDPYDLDDDFLMPRSPMSSVSDLDADTQAGDGEGMGEHDDAEAVGDQTTERVETEPKTVN